MLASPLATLLTRFGHPNAPTAIPCALTCHSGPEQRPTSSAVAFFHHVVKSKLLDWSRKRKRNNTFLCTPPLKSKCGSGNAFLFKYLPNFSNSFPTFSQLFVFWGRPNLFLHKGNWNNCLVYAHKQQLRKKIMITFGAIFEPIWILLVGAGTSQRRRGMKKTLAPQSLSEKRLLA
jgi:hypothetical protein